MEIEYFKRMGETFAIGSHMYGMNTASSDHDELVIYFDYEDYLNPIRQYPDVKEMDNNNTKLYCLDYYAELLLKGNPNLVEVVLLEPARSSSFHVQEFMSLMRANQDVLVHRGVIKAYMGHLTGLVKEMKTKELTPKRLSHAFRIVFTLERTLATGNLFSIKSDPVLRDLCVAIKLNPNVEVNKLILDRAISLIEVKYHSEVGNFPTNESLTTLINEYFRGIYL